MLMTMIEIIRDITMALIQGITGLTMSSASGLMELASRSNGERIWDFHLYMELTVLGLLVALVIRYRKRIVRIFNDAVKQKDYRELINIVLAALPMALVGFLLIGLIRTHYIFSYFYLIIAGFILTGLILYFANRLPRLSKVKNLKELSPKRALLVGAVQTLSYFPGLSRNATSYVSSRCVGLNREDATDITYMSLILILAGMLFRCLIAGHSRQFFAANWLSFTLMNLAIALIAYFVLGFMQRYLKKHDSLKVFAWMNLVVVAVIAFFVLII